jgi:hypothetical protein
VDSAPRPQPFHRRRFLQLAGFGLSTAFGGSAIAQTATPPPATPPPATTPAAPPAAAAPEGPPPISEDARALAEIVRRRYGKHLTPDQLEAVTRELDGRVQAGRRLKDLKLVNSDEPDFTFHA